MNCFWCFGSCHTKKLAEALRAAVGAVATGGPEKTILGLRFETFSINLGTEPLVSIYFPLLEELNFEGNQCLDQGFRDFSFCFGHSIFQSTERGGVNVAFVTSPCRNGWAQLHKCEIGIVWQLLQVN